MNSSDASTSMPRGLAVQGGLMLPPGVLRSLLPDVASVVNNAMTSDPIEQTFRLSQHEDVTATDVSMQPQDTGTTAEQPQYTKMAKKHARSILNPFPCNICKQRFPNRHMLNIHWVTHNNPCKYCKNNFDSKELLLEHRCCMKICKKSFKCEWLYHRHMLSHTFPCESCPKRFRSKKDLDDHKKYHVPNKINLSGMSCQAWLAWSSEKHPIQKTRASLAPNFTCGNCGEIFQEQFSLVSHLRSHGPMKSYSRTRKVAKLSNYADAQSDKRQGSIANISDASDKAETIEMKRANEIIDTCLEKDVTKELDSENLKEIDNFHENVKKYNKRQLGKDIKEDELIDDVKSYFEYVEHGADRVSVTWLEGIDQTNKRNLEDTTNAIAKKYFSDAVKKELNDVIVLKENDKSNENIKDDNRQLVTDIKEEQCDEIDLDDVKDESYFEYVEHGPNKISAEWLNDNQNVKCNKRRLEERNQISEKCHSVNGNNKFDENKSDEKQFVKEEQCDEIECSDMKVESSEFEFVTCKAETNEGRMALGPLDGLVQSALQNEVFYNPQAPGDPLGVSPDSEPRPVKLETIEDIGLEQAGLVRVRSVPLTARSGRRAAGPRSPS